MANRLADEVPANEHFFSGLQLWIVSVALILNYLKHTYARGYVNCVSLNQYTIAKIHDVKIQNKQLLLWHDSIISWGKWNTLKYDKIAVYCKNLF